MKKLLYSVAALLIAVTIIAPANAGPQKKGRTKIAASPVTVVTEEVSVLGQIVEQATKMIEATGTTGQKARREGVAQLKQLIPDLDPEVKKVIIDDLNIILVIGRSEESQTKARKAYDRLMATINAMNANAQVVQTIDNAQKVIEAAPADQKQQVAAEQLANIQAAEDDATEAGMMSRAIAGVKSTLAIPSDYIFGKERTAAKTAFEAFIGTLTLAGIAGAAYVGYQYTPEGTSAAMKARVANLYRRGKTMVGMGEEEEQAMPITAKMTSAELLQNNIVVDARGNVMSPGSPGYSQARNRMRKEAGAVASGVSTWSWPWSKKEEPVKPQGWLDRAKEWTYGTIGSVASVPGSVYRRATGETARQEEAAARQEEQWRESHLFAS